ncbi:MAG TPA: arsenate reductase (glutaredoxin) [Cellvibrio sp.]|nr:arsenate reductase (glutaredoxin) [Cellvibrio sp.]
MITLYHNPRCSKSRQALALLQEHGIEPDVRLYLENPPTTTELKKLLVKLGIGARDLLRTGEDAYKELNLKDERLSDTVLIKAMAAHPKLIERPIAIKGDRAVIGRPPENLLALL